MECERVHLDDTPVGSLIRSLVDENAVLKTERDHYRASFESSTNVVAALQERIDRLEASKP
jgi:hypothetical protein